jgi:integrase
VTGAPVPVEQAVHSVLLAKLMGAVRTEFRADPLSFAVDDPVFGGTACLVGQCPRTARGNGLCPGHRLRWVDAGRPEVASFAASTDPRWQRELPNGVCRATGCGYGIARMGVCQLHWQRWERSGHRGDMTAWLANPLPIKEPTPGAICRISHCALWPQASWPFCLSHTNSWKASGRGDVEAFAGAFDTIALPTDEAIGLGQLGTQLRLELQYALQCRHDDRTSKMSPAVVNRLVRFLVATNTTSLLDHPEVGWRVTSSHRVPEDPSARALLVFARRKVDDLAHDDGWDAEYARLVWQLRRLGYQGNETFSFEAISQPWLVELVKRWLRWRLSTGLSVTTVRRSLGALTRFSGFCERSRVTGLDRIDRAVLERYLADLQAKLDGAQQQGVHVGQLNAFFQAIRQHRWDDTLPASAVFFTEDFPKRTEQLPRALAEQVMAQIEHPDTLAQWTNPAHRLVTIILIRCGLRVTDALRLPADCLVTDSDGAPYLRYDNHKMKRQALVPIDEELQALIITERARTAASPWLFPRATKNPDGQHPTDSSTYRLALYRWLELCEVRDAHGLPVHLTPHQWRHTLGTRLINRDVPQEVVRQILDHDSPQMTAHYARLHDSTVRRHWEAARKVDIAGQVVVLDPDGPLAEAAWAKQRLGRATQALPNGFCGLPVQKTCPHANACLTCPMFITTAEFLPQHREHQLQVLQIITAAEARGQSRLVEMNQHVARNLDTIITVLENDTGQQNPAADAR